MFIELIEKRRSIRKFTSQKIAPEVREKLIEAALRSPSSRSINPWRFIVVEDPGLLEKLSKAKPHGASFVGKAPLAMVVCADTGQSDVWVEDTSIAAIFIQLAAEDLGLGSCWSQVRKRMHGEHKSADDYIKDLLELPDTWRVASIIAIGYPDEKKAGHSKTSLPYDKVFYNRYGGQEPA